MFYNCFQIWQLSIPGLLLLLYKQIIEVNEILSNFLFRSAEEVGQPSIHSSGESNYISIKSLYASKAYIQDRNMK